MKLSEERIAYLLELHSAGKTTAAEERELIDWVAKGNEKPIRAHIEKLASSHSSEDETVSVDWELLYQRILEERTARDVSPMMRRISWPYWIAAAVAVLLGASYFYFLSVNAAKPEAGLAGTQQLPHNDIAAPAAVNAVLTLANGEDIILDSSSDGMLAIQGTVKVMKLPDGQIAYEGTGKEIQFNTLHNPRGSRVVGLTLADGTRVWLNAASSLKYPTAFTGRERRVEITGEAYFEVAHNAAVPFMVKHGDVTVRVLGTHFNVNTYEDEVAQRITLLEGSVRVDKKNKSTLLVPGQQASMSHNDASDIRISAEINTDEVMAWRDGKFQFGEGMDIGAIMRQLSRWYNVDVTYEGEVHQRFFGSISKDVNVSQVLKILEATGGVKFKMEGNTIAVMPGKIEPN